MPREETRLQILTFSDLQGTPLVGVVLANLRAGTIIWDVAVVITSKDGDGRTMDIQTVEEHENVTTALLDDIDTSPAAVPALSAASKVAAVPTVPRYFGSDTVLSVKPSALTEPSFTYSVIVTMSSVL